MKKMLLKKVIIEGFKCYKEKKEETFGDSTIFVGGNGKGKSSIADAIAWSVTGKLYSGSKNVDKGFLNEESTKAVVELFFDDESGIERKIKRSFTEASGVSVWLDGKKTSQKALSEQIDIDTFLLAFNPLTFLGKRPGEARSLFINLVDVESIDNKAVLSQLPKDNQDNLTSIDLSTTDTELKKIRKAVSDKEKEGIVLNGYISKNNTELSNFIIPEKKAVSSNKILEEQKKLEEIITKKPDMSEYMTLLGKKSVIEKQIAEVKASKFDTSNIFKLESEKSLLLRDIQATEKLTFNAKNMIALETELANQEKEVYRLQVENSSLKVKIKDIRKRYAFKTGDTCPACRQLIDENALINIKDFIGTQTQEYMDKGIENKSNIETLEIKVKKLLGEIEKVKLDEEKRKKEFEANKAKKIATLKSQVKKIEEQINNLREAQKNFLTNINSKVHELNDEISKIDLVGAKKDIDQYEEIIETQRQLIEELKKDSEKTIEFNKEVDNQTSRKEQLQKEITEYESKTKVIDDEISELKDVMTSITQFNQTKIRLIEENIKKYFDKVSFKIEEVNDSTGEITSCFKVLYDKKPIETCSLSEQVKAGIEITEMVQNTLGLEYPVFLDNNESVTEVKSLKRQVIRAVVIDVPEVMSIQEDLLNEVYESAKNIVLKAS